MNQRTRDRDQNNPSHLPGFIRFPLPSRYLDGGDWVVTWNGNNVLYTFSSKPMLIFLLGAPHKDPDAQVTSFKYRAPQNSSPKDGSAAKAILKGEL